MVRIEVGLTGSRIHVLAAPLRANYFAVPCVILFPSRQQKSCLAGYRKGPRN